MCKHINGNGIVSGAAGIANACDVLSEHNCYGEITNRIGNGGTREISGGCSGKGYSIGGIKLNRIANINSGIWSGSWVVGGSGKRNYCYLEFSLGGIDEHTGAPFFTGYYYEA